jgi:hypothetical protein
MNDILISKRVMVMVVITNYKHSRICIIKINFMAAKKKAAKKVAKKAVKKVAKKAVKKAAKKSAKRA